MTAAGSLNQLSRLQSLLIDNLTRASHTEHNRQYHPDLSPLGWHLGHCVFTDIYWLREVLLDDDSQSEELKALYVPEFSPKDERAAVLPGFDDLHRWAEKSRIENLSLLRKLLDSTRSDRLLKDGYVIHFLSQHYAQHYETTMYVLAQCRSLRGIAGNIPMTLRPRPLSRDAVTVPEGEYCIGSEDGNWAYDNESPPFRIHLQSFRIATNPVSNGEYLCFMEDGGYERSVLWPKEGWRWRSERGVTRPEHWYENDAGGFYGINENGGFPLLPGAPVHGLSYYEAQAFARWAGCRLPHEYEWEAAKKNGLFNNDGRVWEWCANAFHPYEGFEAFPYQGYSVPYFDNRHLTLRGGSDYTCSCIKRPSFRNYYEADKRHIHAGLRLVYPGDNE